MSDARELDLGELEPETAEALPEREALSLAALDGGVFDIGFDHPMLPAQRDAYDAPDDAA